MQVRDAAAAPQVDTGQTRTGDVDDKVMLEGPEGSANNYRMLLEAPITDWTTPRHRHDFDQIRYAARGDLDYAPGKILPEGWVAYFPEGVYYGPQVKKPGLLLALFQFGGASGHGYSSNRQKKAAYDAMLKNGKFENGVYTYVDEQGQRHNQDAAEARRELVIGRKVEYRPRYEDLIIMNPANYDWIKDPQTPGIARKFLGCFTERQMCVGFIRLDPGATMTFGAQRAPEMVFIAKGSVRVGDNSTCGQYGALSFEPEDGRVPVSATEPTEFLWVELHKFDQQALSH